MLIITSDYKDCIIDHCSSLVQSINAAAMLSMSQYYSYLKDNEKYLGANEGRLIFLAILSMQPTWYLR
jgi:hypothetical protein